MISGRCLRIYTTESDRIDGKPALEAIVGLCKEAGVHGVSVVRCVEGMGRHGIHSASFLSLASDLPLLVEIIDTEERIEQAIATLRPHLADRLVATWPVQLLRTGWNGNGEDAP
ncbi:MAG: DUF190 domain-containing protein [Zetaproteobacteria bacterium]|nr:MAG: DUF190 domain-containing protein [Zetaproteobacteria bacterium]